MKVFKFVVPTDQYLTLPSDSQISVKGCAAVVLAPDRETAVELLKRELAELGQVSWWEVATVTEFTTDVSGVRLIVQM